jgi:hypothetical protein
VFEGDGVSFGAAAAAHVARRRLGRATHLPVALGVVRSLLACWLRHCTVVVIDMPLLVETGAYKAMGLNMMVACTPDAQVWVGVGVYCLRREGGGQCVADQSWLQLSKTHVLPSS